MRLTRFPLLLKEGPIGCAKVTEKSINQISSVVQTNSATAEETAASSEELSGQAQMLKQMIGQYRITSRCRRKFFFVLSRRDYHSSYAHLPL